MWTTHFAETAVQAHQRNGSAPLQAELEDSRRALAKLDTSGSERVLSVIAKVGSRSMRPTEGFKVEIDALAPAGAPDTWEKLLSANAIGTLREIVRITGECSSLRKSMEKENEARAARRFSAPDKTLSVLCFDQRRRFSKECVRSEATANLEVTRPVRSHRTSSDETRR